MFDNISRCLPCSSLKFVQGAGAIWGAAYEVSNVQGAWAIWGAAYEVSNVGAIFDPWNLSSDPLIFVRGVHCTHSNNFQNEY